MDINMNMNMKIDPSFEYEGIDDQDDVFYAEIRRQILLLTADDEEDYQETIGLRSVEGASKQGSNKAIGNLISSSLQHGSYFTSWENQSTNSVPTCLANLWRHNNGNGTGVFIPQIVKSRRRHRPGRMNKRRVYRAVETTQS